METRRPPREVPVTECPSRSRLGNRLKSRMFTAIVLYSWNWLTCKELIQPVVGRDKVLDPPRWVHSVAKEEWTAEVFDAALIEYQNIEE
ncbi:hypothetical protein CASFOL_040110 [Castilleja foliolosa]|uniref:Transposase n=1 Tax=Castilleja foliolosa TaxID=1961234 RepID=A0ABD3BEI2_9LAMI